MKGVGIIRRMKQYEEHIVVAFLTHWKAKEIQAAAEISKNKYYELKNDKDFQRILTERRSEFVREAVLKMESYLSEDVEILQTIIRDENTSAQVKVNAINLMMSQLNQWKQTTEMLDRLQMLEDAQGQKSDILGVQNS